MSRLSSRRYSEGRIVEAVGAFPTLVRRVALEKFGPGAPVGPPRIASTVRCIFVIAATSSLYLRTLAPMTIDVLARRKEYGSPTSKGGLFLNVRLPRIFSSECSTALRK